MKKRVSRSFNLIERKGSGTKFIEFPRVKGRTVDKIEFFSMGEAHYLIILFQDKTALNLNITSTFTLDAQFQTHKPDSIKILKRWPPIPFQH